MKGRLLVVRDGRVWQIVSRSGPDWDVNANDLAALGLSCLGAVRTALAETA